MQKGKWRFAFDCRSLQIRWFLSDYTQCWLSGDSLLVFSSDQLRWQMASAGWQVGDGEIGSWKTRKTKIKLFALTTFSLHDYF